MVYTTNEDAIVRHAKFCYKNYHTIVNNVPKDKNKYDNTPENFALIDNQLAASQMAIGESSNLAQLALSYTYTYPDKKYEDYVCILATIAQIAIDSAKRAYSVDVNKEIRRIKNNMDIERNLYPSFWKIIKPDFQVYRKSASDRERRNMINYGIHCPMSILYKYKPPRSDRHDDTIPIGYFLNTYALDENRRRCKNVERLIEKYQLKVLQTNIEGDMEGYILLRDDFDELIYDIRRIHISNNYLGLMSWLINRAFMVSDGVQANQSIMDSRIGRNKPILLRTLYAISPKQFLQVFSKNA